eukprot:2954547-Pyramimonas_sp.AAC.1
MERRLASVETTSKAQGQRISVLEDKITRLEELFGNMQSERPAIQPIPDADFMREPDPTIIVARTKKHGAAKRSQELS